jgi:hypothetical protein
MRLRCPNRRGPTTKTGVGSGNTTIDHEKIGIMNGVRRPPQAADDRAYATAELVLGIALLLLPVMLIVLTLPTWAERRSMAHSAAHDAALALARSTDWPAGKARADQIVEEMAHNYGLRGDDSMRLTWEPDRGAARVARGETVTAVIRVPTPGVFVPGVGYIGRWELTVRHSETVDRYRSL